MTLRSDLPRPRASQRCCATLAAMALLSMWAASPALAGPPFVTDDPEPVELHHHEFYIASQQTLGADGRAGTLPHFEFNYGALPNLQLHVIAPLAFSAPQGKPTRRGFGDLELGAKYRFTEETDAVPMVGIFPIYLGPTGAASRGLGNDASQLFLPVWLQKSWGPWTSYGGGGYWINRASGAKNNWFFGWLLQRKLSDKWMLGSEVFYRGEQLAGQGSSMGANVGGSFDIDEHAHLLFSVGKGLRNANATNKLSSYVAFQLTY
ncbi:MAG: hypothetical protein ABIV63_07005 [Caldimonas sp.]